MLKQPHLTIDLFTYCQYNAAEVYILLRILPHTFTQSCIKVEAM